MHYSEWINDKRYDLERWIFDYNLYPYLNNVSTDILEKRFYDLVNNIIFLGAENKNIISYDNDFASTLWWFKKLEQTAYVLKNKKVDVDIKFEEDLIYPNKKYILHANNIKNIKSIFRYSDIKHIISLIDKGIIRLTNVQSYSKMLGDNARFDDENTKSSYVYGNSLKLYPLNSNTPLAVNGDMKKSRTASKYYLSSFSTDLDIRLFDIFKCNAVICITNINLFIEKIKKYSHNISHLYKECLLTPAKYYDPYRSQPTADYNPTIAKDFSFAYQREMRLILDPLETNNYHDDHIYLELGSLRNIASAYLYEAGELIAI
ncbi:hypothetical protein [Bilophila wadsworthia]|uniref:hypothetical protein n=1 Tax=Bilophila wadsworthia TaxID=35833 RepID=UPI00266BE9D8|nr:hypothetical protein [Bilophila wadsworthia]